MSCVPYAASNARSPSSDFCSSALRRSGRLRPAAGGEINVWTTGDQLSSQRCRCHSHQLMRTQPITVRALTL